MTFPLFDCDAGNLLHVARHGVTADEVEAALFDPHQLTGGHRIEAGEERFGVIGATGRGRILFISYTLRSGLIRVVTAYPADRRRQRAYQAR